MKKSKSEIIMKTSKKGEIFFQKQGQMSLQCGLHSVNNLLRFHAYSEKDLVEICYQLSDQFINPHKHVLGGDYDANVIIMAVERKNYKTQWIDNRKQFDLHQFQGKRMKGFLINTEQPKKFYHKMLGLSARHWSVIFEEKDTFHYCDSQKQQLKKIGKIQEVEEEVNNFIKQHAEVIAVFE